MNAIRNPSQPFAPAGEARARTADLRRRLVDGQLDVTVVGGGRSGGAAVELLQSKGVTARVLDDRPPERLSSDLRTLVAGKIERAHLASSDLVVLSPGVPRAGPELADAVSSGKVISEVELASWFIKAPMIGITGTNGKSTTTALTAHILATAGKSVFAGGNLGAPLSELATSPDPVDVAVVELSSYQLESIVEATFAVSCWLNVSPDHLDRYPDIETYAAAKRRILERRSINGVAVLNAKDHWCSSVGIRMGGPIRWFAAARNSDLAGPMGTLAWDGEAVTTNGADQEVFDLSNRVLIGQHNAANAAAAIECARAIGVEPEHIQRGLDTFAGLPHRLELVPTDDGVRWYNDSKATNVASAVTGVRAVPGTKILIAGGQDKGAPWTELVESLATEARVVLAIGDAAAIVDAAFRGRVPVEIVGTMEAAVERAQRVARPGDAVLLSPACASFDQYDHFEARGDHFRRLVAGAGD